MKQELRSGMYYLWWVLLLAMVAPSFFSRIGVDPQKAAVVTVNGEPLTVVQFKRQYSMMQSERMIFNQRYGLNLDTSVDPVSVINRGTEGLLLDAIAQAQGYIVDQEILGLMIKNSLAEALGFDKRAFNMDFYNYYVRQIGMSIREFEQDQEVMVKRALVDEAVRAAAYTPAFAESKADQFKKSFSLLRFPQDFYVKNLKKNASFSQEELSAFYETNKKSYALPDIKNVSYITVDPHQYEKNVTIGDEQVEAFYARRKDSLYKDKDQFKMRRLLIAVPADVSDADLGVFKQKAEALVQKAVSKQEEFADLVTRASDDEKTCKKGGMTDTFSAGTYAPQLEAELVKLETPGQITPVVRTAQGFEAAQLVSKHIGSYKKLESVRKEIVSTLTKRTALDLLKADIDGVLRNLQDGEVDLVSFAEQQGLKVEETGTIDSGAAQGDSLKAELAKKAFGSFMVKASSRGSFVFHDKHILFAVTRSQTDRFEDFDAIISKVQDDLIKQKAEKALNDDVLSAQKAFFDGEYNIASLHKEFPETAIQETGMIKLKDSVKGFDKDPAVTEKLFKIESAGMLARIDSNDGDVVLATLVASEHIGDNSKNEKTLEKNHEKAESNLMRGLIATLKRTAKIDIINEEFFTSAQ